MAEVRPATSAVTAVILNWNRWRDTVACVLSVQAQDYPTLDVLVVDNGSSDDSEQMLREQLPDTELVQSGRNLGFGGGCNLGIRRAVQCAAKYVWLLNNDATVSPQTLSAMVALAEASPGLGAVGAVIHDADGSERIQCWGGGVVNTWLGRSRPNLMPGALDYLTGACLLLRVDALSQIGLFDEKRYFMYWEDVDLCFRLRRAGWGLAVADRTQVWHEASSSLGLGSPQADCYATCSVIRFLRVYARFPTLSIALNVISRMLLRLGGGRWMHLAAVYRGFRKA
ncbi:MAG: glycosyltransferase family 2 protein [Pseudomonadota bacterium]